MKAEKTAAEGALTGWKKMLSKAIHPESGLVVEDSVMERLKSLDAAWARFDHVHYSLLNQVVNMSNSDREEEQEDWEKQMEQYCVAKEEGLAALKKVGMTNMKVSFAQFESGETDDSGRMEINLVHWVDRDRNNDPTNQNQLFFYINSKKV